jgi:hypothetical protein
MKSKYFSLKLEDKFSNEIQIEAGFLGYLI